MTARSFGSGSGKRQRHLALERLEDRSLLAGNVNVFVSGGSLFVRGDNADNLVLIQQTGDGEYTVTGLDFADADFANPPFSGGPTRINGQFETQTFSGVTGDINIDLKKGDDGVGIGNSVEDLSILAAECGFGFAFGSDSIPPDAIAQQVEGELLLVPLNLIVNTNDGSDGVFVIADVTNSAIVNTGNGNDAVAFGNAGLFQELPRIGEGEREEGDIFIGNDLVINTASGLDAVCIHLATVHDLISVQTGNQDDRVEMAEFDAGHAVIGTGNGNDFVDLFSFDLDRELVVISGGGNDDVFIESFSAGQGFGPQEQSGAGFATVATGAGNDEAELFDFAVDGVVVNTGAGNDGTVGFESPVTVEDASITYDLVVVTGAGNDFVEVEEVSARNITVDTGAGNDGNVVFPVAVYNVEVENNLVVVTGAGNDFAFIFAGAEEPEPASSTIGNSLILNTGAGNDFAAVVDQLVGNDLHVILGAGNDSLQVAFTQIGRNSHVDAGAGNDTVSIDDVHAANGTASIFMGAGNDTLNLFSSTARRLRAFGGPGRDTFNNGLGIDANGSYDLDGDGENDAEVREFEVFNTIIEG